MQHPHHSTPARRANDASQSHANKRKRLSCKICKEPFDTLLFAVSVRQGKAHPLCAGLKAIGLEKLAITSGR